MEEQPSAHDRRILEQDQPVDGDPFGASSSQEGHRIDLHPRPLRKGGHLHTGAGRGHPLAEDLAIERIHPREIAEVDQIHGGANHLMGARSGGLQHGREIGENLAGFRLHIPGSHEQAGGGVEGDLTGTPEQRARPNGLVVGPHWSRGGVGGDGGGGMHAAVAGGRWCAEPMASPLAREHTFLMPADLPVGDQVRLQDLWHRYPGAGDAEWTLAGIDLALHQGELMGLLGPSGCGKTTLLRLIAGFERPARGSVVIEGHEVAGPRHWLPPERRGVGMVFQDYALFPHLDAWRNACFGLRPGQDTSKVAWLLELLGLDRLHHRYPHELSGGQRQRLALARALAPGPSVVLLDEPFSNLDVEVRLRLRSELPALLDRCGASGLIVTHDPEEALAICHRVAVLREGILHQCASPLELVRQPATAFVGRFVLQGNLLPARWRGDRLHTPLGLFEPANGFGIGRHEPSASGPSPQAEPLQVLVSPQALDLVPDPEGSALVQSREFLGREWLYQVEAGGLHLRLRLPLQADYGRGQRGRLRFVPTEAARLFPQGVELVALPEETLASCSPR